MVREGVLKLAKVDCTKNPANVLTKSVPAPKLEKHSEYLLGTQTPFQAYMAVVGFGAPAVVAAV
eukprot:575547-Rhodomonas_salina.1